MSIATRLEAIEQHLTDDYSVLTLAGADLTNVDKNIVNLKPTWKERLLYFMNNGTDTVWNNWDKVNGTGTSITLNNTEYAPMKIEYGGNTSQDSTTGKNLFSGQWSQFTSTGGSGTTYGYYRLPTDEKYIMSMTAKNTFTTTSTTFMGFSLAGGIHTGGVKWCISQRNGTVAKGTRLVVSNDNQGTILPYVSIFANDSATLKSFVDNFDIQVEK